MSSPPKDPIEAAKRIIMLREAATSFRSFIKAAFPQFVLAPFHEELIEILNALENGTLGKRAALITMPPRHGKSTIANVAFPAYYMMRKATRRILAVSYGADLAANFGRQVRDLTQEQILAQAFPNFQLNPTFLLS